jgi:protein arginine N-methyltransferase 1
MSNQDSEALVIQEEHPRETIEYQRFLLADQKRLDIYKRAITQTVKPGDVVLDLGAGLGILSFFACQAGAQRVYAIEASGAIELAKEVAERNGFSDRIIFLKDFSYGIGLPEKVDVIVTDTFETFGINGGLLGATIDARQRFLKPGGAIIPESIDLLITPVEISPVHKTLALWNSNPAEIDFSPLASYALNHVYPAKLRSEALLANPTTLRSFDLKTVTSSNFLAETSLTVSRSGVLVGLGGWFRANLAQEISFSNGLESGTTNYAHAYFPIEVPAHLETGDLLKVSIASAHNGQTWSWRGEVFGRFLPSQVPHREELLFQQSTFFGFPLPKKALLEQRRKGDSAPGQECGKSLLTFAPA